MKLALLVSRPATSHHPRALCFLTPEICRKFNKLLLNINYYVRYRNKSYKRSRENFDESIGLVKDNKSILGVLYLPALNLLVKAEKGKGAFANDKKINVSNRELKKSLYYSGGYYKGELQLKKSIGDKVGIIKVIDASSYEFAQIAMGDAELYILANVPHDVVAGIIIVKEAGGKVTDYDGTEWSIRSNGIVASNKVIHKDVIKLL